MTTYTFVLERTVVGGQTEYADKRCILPKLHAGIVIAQLCILLQLAMLKSTRLGHCVQTGFAFTAWRVDVLMMHLVKVYYVRLMVLMVPSALFIMYALLLACTPSVLLQQC